MALVHCCPRHLGFSASSRSLLPARGIFSSLGEAVVQTDLALSPQCMSPNSATSLVRRRGLLEFGVYLGMLAVTKDDAAALEAESIIRGTVGLENGRLQSCEGAAPCVSTSAFLSPSRFMPPWSYLGSQEDAFRDLLKALARMGAEIVKNEDGLYIYATMSTSTSKDGVDDLEFLFVGKAVCFRSVSRQRALEPPFCWWPGCINGPRNRGRMEALRDELGWVQLETDEGSFAVTIAGDRHWLQQKGDRGPRNYDVNYGTLEFLLAPRNYDANYGTLQFLLARGVNATVNATGLVNEVLVSVVCFVNGNIKDTIQKILLPRL